MNTSSLLAMAATSLVVVAAPAAAQTPTADFDAPAGAMRDVLMALAGQSGAQIFFTSDVVAGLQAPGVRGRMTLEAALDRALAGSGLVWLQSRPGVISIRRAAAQAASEPSQVEDIVVTGSLLRSSGPPASPVVRLDRGDLDRRSAATVAEAVIDLPQNYAGSGTPGAAVGLADRAGSNSGLATGVNLRGLGADATLTLINGRRLAGSGFRAEFSDLSALPSSAVERVDVLLDGASALYGSDAVAGVVNVIMRRTYDGQETRLRAGVGRNGGETLLVSHLLGRQWAEGAAVLSYEYQTSNGLNSGDRPYTRDGDLRPFGGGDRRGFFSSPGNILVVDPASGGLVPRYGVRPNASGYAQTPQDFADGQPNLASQFLGVDLTPDVERNSLYGSVRQALTERLEFSGDVRFSRRAFSFQNGATVSLFAVTPANPFFVSPDGSSSLLMAYSFFSDLGPTRQAGRVDSVGVTAGADYDLGRGWSAASYLALARERERTRLTGQINSRFLNEALGNIPDDPATSYSPGRDGYFNPFGGGDANGAAVLDFIGGGFSSAVGRSRSDSANLLVSGPLLALPGGMVDLALGAQFRTEALTTSLVDLVSTVAPRTTLTPRRERQISAVFAEARLPVVGETNARRGVERLEISVAGRVERYDDFGVTSNPKIGVVWSPASSWTVRASYGTSFRAPSLPQLFDETAVVVTTADRADGSTVLALYRYGGNPDLQPETARTWTWGADYAPSSGWRLSLNYFDTRFDGRISEPVSEALEAVLTDPALAPFVKLLEPANKAEDLALVQRFTSDPAFAFGGLFPDTAYGALLDARWVNAAAVRVRGVDFSARAPFTLASETLRLDASASYILDYDTQITPLAPKRSVVGVLGFPVGLRSRAGLGWTRGPATADLSWTHVAGYDDNLGGRVKAWNTFDLQLGWEPERGPLAGSRVAFDVSNLFDADPPFYDSPVGFGFDPGQANPLGRAMSLQLIKRW